MATKYNLAIEQGATFRRTLTWQQANKRPVNLTGYTALLQVRETAAATGVLLSLSTENGGLTIAGSTGQITILITDEQSLALTFTSGVYDLLLMAPNGDRVRLIEGKVTVSPCVTKTA